MSATRDSRVEENLPEAAGSRAGESWFVSLLHALIRRRRSILYFVLASGVVSAVWSLITPSIYESQTKILLPQQTPSVTSLFASSSLAGLAASKDLSSALRNPTDVYVSMLASRSITDAIIDRFHLMDVYKTKLRTACRLKLNARVILTAEKGNIISIVVQDEDPKRAAEIANGFVEELSRFNQALNLSEAVERRKFFEGQLDGERESLVQAENSMIEMQKTSKLISPERQTQVTMEGIGRLYQQIAEREVQLRAVEVYGTENNAAVIELRGQLAGLREQLSKFERQNEGSGSMLSTAALPTAGLDYIRHYREVKYHEALMEILLRQYEAAKLDEGRQSTTIQVLDRAVSAEVRTRPRRKLIVGGAVLLALFLSFFWVLGLECWALLKANEVTRGRLETLRAAWKR